MKDIKNGKGMTRVLTIKEILDDGVRIETIKDMDTLKSLLCKIIGSASYSKIKYEDIDTIMENIYAEFDMKK